MTERSWYHAPSFFRWDHSETCTLRWLRVPQQECASVIQVGTCWITKETSFLPFLTAHAPLIPSIATQIKYLHLDPGLRTTFQRSSR